MRRACASDPEGQMSRRAFASACTLLAGKVALAAPTSPALLEAAADEKDVDISDEVQRRSRALLLQARLSAAHTGQALLACTRNHEHTHWARGPRAQELRKKLEYDVTKNQFMVTGTLTRSLYDEVVSCRIFESLLFFHFPCKLSSLPTRAVTRACMALHYGWGCYILFLFFLASDLHQSAGMLARTQECTFTDEIDTYTLDKWIQGTALLFKNDYSKVSPLLTLSRPLLLSLLTCMRACCFPADGA